VSKNPVIEVKNLRFRYPDGQEALRGVNLRIYENESVALLGPNGAGKSTLLLNLNGVLRGEGEIFICGLPLNDKNLREIRRLIGVVFQDPDDQLFMPTVYDDVAFGPLSFGIPLPEVKERVAEALKAVGLKGYEKRSPHHLSLGEKKRASIATVLSLDPEILVLDEPTSNLDPRGRRQLIELLNSLHHTKIIATHDLSFAWETADRIALIYQGEIVAFAEKRKILLNDNLLLHYGLEPLSSFEVRVQEV
jgi:cobalt/nickel transport system ATP-binding protein